MALTKVEAEQLQPAQTSITSLGTLTALTVDDITIDGSTISDSGDFTIDAGGDIILDTGGDDIKLKVGGTDFGSIYYSNSNLYLKSAVSNGDVIFQGNDDGSTVTALTLDMSDAGAATFNAGVTASRFDATTASTTDPVLQLTDSGVADYDFTFPDTSTIQLGTNTTSDKTFKLLNAGSGVFSLSVEGNVGIGTDGPDNKLHVYKGDSGHTWSYDTGDIFIAENNSSISINIATPSGDSGNILFSDNNARGQGRIIYNHPDDSMGFYTSGISNERMRIDSSGHVGINNAGTINGTGARVLQVESTTSSALGPEVLIHNSGQGANAKAALTFGGKRSGNEGYTASIHTTNNDGMYFGTVAATNFSALPTTRMHIDEDGYITTPYQPYIRCQGNSASRVTNHGTIVDPFNNWATATSRGITRSGGVFTVPVAGEYLITYSFYFWMDNIGHSVSHSVILKYGSTNIQESILEFPNHSGTGSYLYDNTVSNSIIVSMSGGDTFQFRVYADIYGGVPHTNMSAYLLG